VTRLVLTSAEARAHADGKLTEIRRKVDDPPRWWSFTPTLDGSETPSRMRVLYASKSKDPRLTGTFPRSIDVRDPQPPFAAPLGRPGTVLDIDGTPYVVAAVRVERVGEIWEWVYGVENVL